MTARKTTKTTKPKPRKASGPTLEQRVAEIEAGREFDQDWLEELDRKIKSIEARAHFRDKSHDEPVSNAGEAIGFPQSLVDDLQARPAAWRRFLRWMSSP